LAAGFLAVFYVLTGYVIFYSKEEISQPLSAKALDATDSDSIQDIQAYIHPPNETSNYPIRDADIPAPQITAKSAIVYDLASAKILFEKEPNNRLPIASLTKIMSAVIVIENLRLDDVVTITAESIKVDGEKQDLYLGEKITVESLLKYMLIASSNDSAYALKNYAVSQGIPFIQKMNDKAEQLKMNNSRFIDPAGLNDDAYSGTNDLKKLIEYSLKYDIIWQTLANKEATIVSEDENIKHNIQNTNKLLGVLPNLIGGKTGNTEGALGCMILILDVPEKNDKILIVVLGSTERFDDARKLGEWAFKAFRWK
jgi:D-alanyl-D-alanine carboxypeptidase (penicillin-binding protein 5/6)